eukprot:scaffold35458_cov183-Amphora_coffeaeformis.AAC.1
MILSCPFRHPAVRWALLSLQLLLLLSSSRIKGTAASSSPSSSRQNVGSLLSQWAAEHGVVVHEHLQFKPYDDDDDDDDDDGDNWGVQLAQPVPRGTLLLQVPRHLVLEARQCRQDILSRVASESFVNGNKDEASIRSLVQQRLGKFSSHQDNFYIFLALYCAVKDDDNNTSHHKKWAPWIQSLPR